MNNIEEVKGEVVEAANEKRKHYFPVIRSKLGGDWFPTTISGDYTDKNKVIDYTRQCWKPEDYELKLVVVEL
jgi:hypothetical protein